jgi:hypothetical protein
VASAGGSARPTVPAAAQGTPAASPVKLAPCSSSHVMHLRKACTMLQQPRDAPQMSIECRDPQCCVSKAVCVRHATRPVHLLGLIVLVSVHYVARTEVIICINCLYTYDKSVPPRAAVGAGGPPVGRRA